MRKVREREREDEKGRILKLSIEKELAPSQLVSLSRKWGVQNFI